MIELYMILPSEYVISHSEVDMPMCVNNEAVLWIGWKHNYKGVTSVPIGTVNDKTALHLACKDHVLDDLRAHLDELYGPIDHLSDENIAQTEAALCLAEDIKICRDLNHLKARDPDFAGTVSGTDPDTGEAWERDVVIDTVIMP